MSRKHIKDTRRFQLIDANMACIARYGLADTTIAHVAKAAQMSRGIVNFYFESKEKMMQQTLAQLTADYQRTLAQAVEEAQDKRAAWIEAHFTPKLCQGKRLAVWLAFVAHAASHAPYRKLLAASQDKAVELLASACPELPPAYAAELKALIDGLWLQCALAPDAGKREALAAQCLAFAGRMSVSSPERPPAPVKTLKKQPDLLPQLAFDDLFAEKA